MDSPENPRINSLFNKFRKTSEAKNKRLNSKCVIYTRVSTKEQAENNLSLQVQYKTCVDYARKLGLEIAEYFGGTYESAKSDERTEFKRMINLVKKRKDKISTIIVYSLDRFSRSSASAIYITSLLKKEGISVLAATQPTDVTTASGTLQQSIHFIFSEYDNQVRRERCMAGTKEKLLRGEWVSKPPFGYDVIHKNGDRKIIINENGAFIRKAFEWKGYGTYTNAEILIRLNQLGIKIQPQLLSRIFRNPFYCGLIVHQTLDGELVEGKQEKMISQELFLKVNRLMNLNPQGWKIKADNQNIPLKRFLICKKCGHPLRAYMVKRKKLYYYKCGTLGCCVNMSANKLHVGFEKILATFEFSDASLALLKEYLLFGISEHYSINKEAEENLSVASKNIELKLDRLKERYAEGKIDNEIYQEFAPKFKEELANLEERIDTLISCPPNFNRGIERTLDLANNLRDVWRASGYHAKQKLQFLLFPSGLLFSKINGDKELTITQSFDLLQYTSLIFKDNENNLDKTEIEL